VVRFSEEDRKTIWDVREGWRAREAHRQASGPANSSLRKFIADAGGRRPTPRECSQLRLSLEEREEISRGLAAGLSARLIAQGMGRSASTICREVNANGGRTKYRALQADRGARRRAWRPKRAKLAQCRRLRSVVERKLEDFWSPQQISGWLAERYPNDPEMQVSHETIYQSLFVQSRGALRKELHSCLRTGRAMRRAKAYTKRGVGQGQIRNMVMISERPAEVADRAVPGHWEGDLIFGKKMTSARSGCRPSGWMTAKARASSDR
jgi:IS30 family transposase